ncbi:MAG: FAD-containing oxidoreductase [Desulfobacterales bacterium]|nr:FAD-containing oxidoreductase [Desulfobacterales bacterium]
MEQFDAIIIGTGQAGPALAVRLTQAGYRTAIIERHLFYGTCVNTGCIPTKTMIASAKAAHMARHAADYGVTVNGDVRVDLKQVKARKDAIVGTTNDQIPQWMTDLPNLSVYKGHARFEDTRTVRVGEQRLSADKIFINVGARAFVPPLPGLSEVDYLTNSDMMRLEELPAHLVIIGGSYVGLEFAQMFRRFGSEVTVIEKGPRLIGREDKDVSDAVHDILAGEGVNVRLNAECIGVGKKGDEVSLQLDCRNGGKEVNGSHLLVAVGRRPNTDDLGGEKVRLELDERGYVVVDDQLRTSVAGIWALGDCNGQGAFTHTAYNDSEIVSANLLDSDPRRVTDRIPTYALYTEPPLGRVGMTEQQVRDSGRKALVGKRPMTRVNRAQAKGDTRGFIKVLVDAETEKILGAAILGVGGDEAIHLITDIMYADVSYKVVQRAVHIHPTVSELVPTVLGQMEPLE